MTARNFLASILLSVLLLAGGCTPAPTVTPAPAATPSATVTPAPAPVPTPTPDPILARMEGMTPEEKAAQMLVVGFDGLTAEGDAADYIRDYRVGGLILYGRNVESGDQLVALTNGLKEQNGDYIPLFLSTDQEGGPVERMPPEVAQLPAAYDVGDPALLGRALAAQCGAFGLNMDFAPVLDVWSNPKNTVIGKRAFGGDGETVSARAPEAAYAMMAAGTIPVVKHFPGHGDTETDSHVGLPAVGKTLEELRGGELRPFEAAIQGRSQPDMPATPVPAVMVGHILITNIDPDRPATLSPAVITGLLREELGFTGLVVTDDLTMGAITQTYGVGEACVLAAEAGADLLLVCHNRPNVEAAYAALIQAVQSGRLTEARLDESVYRILSLKETYAVTNDPVPAADVDALNHLVAQVWAGTAS